MCLQVNANELTNGVINAAFMLLFKDAIRLFAAYNEGIINLLGELLSCLSFQNLKWAVLHIDFYQLSLLLVPLTETFELKVSATHRTLHRTLTLTRHCFMMAYLALTHKTNPSCTYQ